MTDTHPPRRILRSIGAVFAGLLANVILSTATDLGMHAAGVFPPVGERMASGLFALPFAYRVVYGVLGSYVAARLAPGRPMAHAMALGAVGILLSVAGAVAMWDAGPPWYSLGIIAVVMPCAWLGGRLAAGNRG